MTRLAEKFTEFVLRRLSWTDSRAYDDMTRVLNDISKFKEDVIKAVNGTQHVRVTTGSVLAGASSLVVVLWDVPFEDTNYTIQAVMEDPSGNLEVRSIESVTDAGFNALVLNNDGGATHVGTIHAVGIYA